MVKKSYFYILQVYNKINVDAILNDVIIQLGLLHGFILVGRVDRMNRSNCQVVNRFVLQQSLIVIWQIRISEKCYSN